ncbi:hypothetical protein F511_31588 [Dorcoceras hygrometricum]|uniref:Uncharacterized protein n=1 Tax=Dorcoceras hygrometricum TaxID=472368 RepID=A0A2Z7A988_9LAMI|nr:hypothetical protein F511_31588 [Dorcoceras hygrometricum]
MTELTDTLVLSILSEVNWLTRSLPKVAPEDKEKQILVEVTKGNPAKETDALTFVDIESFIQIRDSDFVEMIKCQQLSKLSQHTSMHIVSTLAAKEAKMLRWAETYSPEKAFEKRLLVQAHNIPALVYLGLRRQHQLVWKLPGPSTLFSNSVDDAVQFSGLRVVLPGQRAKHFHRFFEVDAMSASSHMSSSTSEAVESLLKKKKKKISFISTVDESINSRYSRRRRRSAAGAGTKKFSRKLQLKIQQMRRGAKYGMSCDDISLDVITISRWISAGSLHSRRKRSSSRLESAGAKQLTTYEEISKLDVNC